MKPSQRKKISKAIKKAWKKGKFKTAFGKPLKSRIKAKLPFEIKSEELGCFCIFLENAERILVTFPSDISLKIAKKIKVAMNTYEPLCGGEIEMRKLNEEGAVIEVLNGRKIIGFSQCF